MTTVEATQPIHCARLRDISRPAPTVPLLPLLARETYQRNSLLSLKLTCLSTFTNQRKDKSADTSLCIL
jgi:hypothetical protein